MASSVCFSAAVRVPPAVGAALAEEALADPVLLAVAPAELAELELLLQAARKAPPQASAAPPAEYLMTSRRLILEPPGEPPTADSSRASL